MNLTVNELKVIKRGLINLNNGYGDAFGECEVSYEELYEKLTKEIDCKENFNSYIKQ